MNSSARSMIMAVLFPTFLGRVSLCSPADIKLIIFPSAGIAGVHHARSSFGGHERSVLLGICLEMELLDQRICVYIRLEIDNI